MFILAYKYIKTADGIYFILNTSLNYCDDENAFEILKTDENIYLVYNNIHCSLNDDIILHLERIAKEADSICLSFGISMIDEYMVTEFLSREIEKLDVGKLITLYNIKK
ncbi:MAG: hypothetical protein GY757_53035 [bacterium]|nr:hypothetical protein [bacterium]